MCHRVRLATGTSGNLKVAYVTSWLAVRDLRQSCALKGRHCAHPRATTSPSTGYAIGATTRSTSDGRITRLGKVRTQALSSNRRPSEGWEFCRAMKRREFSRLNEPPRKKNG